MLHFSLWCMMSAPLMIGCDIRNMTEFTKNTLTHKGLLAINQDPAVRQCIPVSGRKGDTLILFKHLEDGDYAIGIYNFTDKIQQLDFFLYDLGLGVETGYGLEMENLVSGDKILVDGQFKMPVGSHRCGTYRAKLVKL